MTTTTVVTAPRLVRPGDPDWDAVRSTFNLLDDLRPEAIALPESAEEVSGAITWAREHGLQVVVQATGHNAAPLGALEGTLLVNTSRLTGVEIDADALRVRVGAATKWEVVTPRLSELGLAGLHGSSPDVGIVGYSLGGGIGWLSRRHGMQTNAVTAIELVTADGEIVRTDAEHDPDLFWALRGGNGNFGVVTAIEFSVVRMPEVYAGAYFYPVERTAEVLHAWNALMPSLPEEMTTWVSVIHFPPDPMLPDFARGRSLVVLMAAYAGTEAGGRALLAPLHALGPVTDTFAVQPPIGLAELAMDPVEPLPYRSTTGLVDALSEEMVDQLAEASAAGSGIVLLQIRHLGGALARTPAGAGARATLPGEVAVFALGVVPEPALEADVLGALDRVARVIEANRVGYYPNFVEHPADARAFFDAETWERLRRVKAAYDPTDLFRGNHHIAPEE